MKKLKNVLKGHVLLHAVSPKREASKIRSSFEVPMASISQEWPGPENLTHAYHNTGMAEVDARMMTYLLTKENVTPLWPGSSCGSIINILLPCKQTFMRNFIMVRNHEENTVTSGIIFVSSFCSLPKVKQLSSQSFLVILDSEKGDCKYTQCAVAPVQELCDASISWEGCICQTGPCSHSLMAIAPKIQLSNRAALQLGWNKYCNLLFNLLGFSELIKPHL